MSPQNRIYADIGYGNAQNGKEYYCSKDGAIQKAKKKNVNNVWWRKTAMKR
jgi:hypothetical protein